ncbi:hypothetical protein TTHERM_00198400 (macronuclear) [Tetrahymena thermophila SB210]|uniref:Transmembrane protein n=1 Tax=Tetrahymena thermophila (strain SB210) TaxID=312017 RepID=Q22NK9_TETTS|nr:hypothetical protein TTHERM_00198400 [Tetrahymena thermophila SB210]EAR86776.2 hypothetical protein TTHERM_00198400 [Tetrahymena thermophila SB210]|eukprot:XP_001007021.2 hypothetical protein TTHERM_00198400 [Tetrahymena thermophila SB210]
MKTLIIIHFMLNITFLSFGQKDGVSQCNQVCQDCSSDKSFECLGCKYPFYFDQNSYNCVQSCPSGTYENFSMECISCASKFCSSCSSTECYQCLPGYFLNPQDKQGCIANCQDSQYLLDGECVYECSIQSNSYSLDSSSNTCIQLQICPSLSYVPKSQAVGQIQYYSTSISEDNSTMVQIDVQGKVIVKSIPQLVPQTYYTFPQLASIANCVQLVEQSTQNITLSCMNMDTQVFTFYISSGLLLSQNITFNGMKMTFLTQTGFIVQYNFQSYQFYVVDNSSDTLNQILSVQNYQQKNDQFILAINSTNTIFYYDQSFNKNILLQYSSQNTLQLFPLGDKQPYSKQPSKVLSPKLKSQMENLDTQNMWVFYQNNKIDFYQIIFGQAPSLIKSITPQIILYSIMRSNKTLTLIGGQNQTATQVFQISSNKQVTEITSSLPPTFLNSNCFWKTKDIYFSQKQDMLYIFNLNQNSFSLSYTLKLSQPLVCSLTSLDIFENNDEIYLLYQIMQDIQIQELTQSQLTSVNSSQMYFSSEQHNYYYTQLLFNTPAVNYFDTVTNNQILELKGNGIAYQYDLESRQIAKSFYFWDDFYYPDKQSTYQYNYIVLQEEEKLIVTGIRNGVLTVRELNLYTFEILLENQFSHIDITPDQIYQFKKPFYIQSTKTLIVYIYNKYISAIATYLRQLHIFNYNQISNQYNYKFSIRQIANDVQVSQKTGDIIFFLVLGKLFREQIKIYNIYKDIVSLDPYTTLQIVSTQNNKVLYEIPTGAYIAHFVTYGNKVFILSNSGFLQYYDGDTNQIILYQNDYYGQGLQNILHKQNQILFINTLISLIISLDDLNLQLQQVSQIDQYENEYSDIQIPLSRNSEWLQQMVDVKQIFCYEYQNNDFLNVTPYEYVVNFYELDIQLNIYKDQIKVVKYQKIIAQIAIDFYQPDSVNNQNYMYSLLHDNKGFYYPYQNYMVIVVGYRLALISSSNFEILFNYVSQILFMNLAYDIELGYMAFLDNLQDCIFNLKDISLNCISNNYAFSDTFCGVIIQRQKQLIIFYSQYSLRVYSLKEQIYKFVKYAEDFFPFAIYYNDIGSNIIIADQASQSFKIFNLDTYQLLDTSFPSFTTNSEDIMYKV